MRTYKRAEEINTKCFFFLSCGALSRGGEHSRCPLLRKEPSFQSCRSGVSRAQASWGTRLAVMFVCLGETEASRLLSGRLFTASVVPVCPSASCEPCVSLSVRTERLSASSPEQHPEEGTAGNRRQPIVTLWGAGKTRADACTFSLAIHSGTFFFFGSFEARFHYVFQAPPPSRGPPVSASPVMGLQTCSTMSG